MRILHMLVAAWFAILAGPALAQEAAPVPALSIAIGETLTVRVTPDGKLVELSRVRRPVSAAQPAPDTVSFSFFDLSERKSLLNTNGYRHILTYRIRAFVGDQAVANDVCPSVPGFAGVQTWRGPVDRIEISEPREVAEGASPVPMCG